MASSLSGKRSNRLSYRPLATAGATGRTHRDAPGYPTAAAAIKADQPVATGPHNPPDEQSGPRSETHSYAASPEAGRQQPGAGVRSGQSSVRVSWMPPTSEEQMLYRYALSVAIAVMRMTSMTAMTMDSAVTRGSPM